MTKRTRTRTRSSLLALILLSVLMLTACASEPAGHAEPKKSVNLLFNFATSSLDPNVDSSYVSLRAGITETLSHLNDESLEIEPWLAESWDSKDGQNWTFQLRDDVMFHNGNKMDAAAVKASLERAMTDSVAIQNALRIESIDASGHTLTIKTTVPFPEFPSELVHPNTSIIDVTETDYINKPIGTGPFAVSAFTPGASVDLIRYDGYWNGPAKLAAARFSFNEDANARSLALQSGDADIVFRPAVETLDTLKALSGVTVDSTSTFRVHQITMNLDRKPLQDVHVRKAIDALIDRQAIVDTILYGHAEAAKGPFPSSFSFAPEYAGKQSGLDAARSYLREAGYMEADGVMQKNGEPLVLKLLTYSSRADLPLIAQIMQSDAGKLGIDVQIEQIEKPEEYMAANRDWDLATYSNLTAPRGDAGYYLNATFHPKGALNFSGVQDAALTALIDMLNGAIGQQARSELAEQIAVYVDEQAYNSFVLHPNTLVAYKSDKVANWVTSRSEYYMLTNELDVK